VAAAAVRPVERPESFLGAATLYQHLAFIVEDEQRKGAMQQAVAVMALVLVEVAYFDVVLIHQDELFGIE
jgi:hypothetical protein